jgi:hypothetical protein
MSTEISSNNESNDPILDTTNLERFENKMEISKSFENFRLKESENTKNDQLKSSLHETKLLPTPIGLGGDFTNFGESIAIEGDTAVLGAPNMDSHGLAYIYNYDGAIWNEVAILRPSDGRSEDQFGISVSISNNRILIGSSHNSSNEILASGSAYIFEKVNGEWSQSHKLNCSAVERFGRFGHAVSLVGNRAAIGAYDSYNPANEEGLVCIFDFNNGKWVESQVLYTEDSQSKYFGHSLDLSENRIIIGDYRDSSNGSISGAAYIFDFENESWILKQKLFADEIESFDYFGYSVSVNGDKALIGARGDDDLKSASGAAFVFELNNDVWQQKQKLLPSDGIELGLFGYSVNLISNRAYIGSPGIDSTNNYNGAVYVFDYDDISWNQTKKITATDGELNDQFGYSIATFENSLFVGSLLDDDNGINSGSVYFLKYDTFDWVEFQKLDSNTNIGAMNDNFGRSVSFQGNRALIGAPGDDERGNFSGSAYIFDRINNDWVLTQKLTPTSLQDQDDFGFSVSLDGNRAVIGSPQQGIFNGIQGGGKVYVYELIGDTWIEKQKLEAIDSSAGNKFGYSVSLLGDTLAVGSHQDGAGSTYIFDYESGNWNQTQKLIANDGVNGDKFGISISLDINKLVIGAERDRLTELGTSTRIGSAYVFEREEYTWIQTAKIIPPVIIGLEVGMNFGNAVGIKEDILLIGARTDKYNNNYSNGTVYFFRFLEAEWQLVQKLYSINSVNTFNFGNSLDFNESKLVIGADYSNENNINSGAAFIYYYENGSWNSSHNIFVEDGDYNDYFGKSVSLYNDEVLVGANGDDTESGTNSGSAYLFNVSEVIFINGYE